MTASQPWQYRTNCRMPEAETLPSGIFRYAAAIEYDGSNYCGWQRQPHCSSVQSAVEKALSVIANEPVVVVCAGRTDTGVHATNQIVHFDSHAIRSAHNWVLGSNANLPDDVRCQWAGKIQAGFHARFSAQSRTYRYVILNTPRQSALMKDALTWEGTHLSVADMNKAVTALIGEHDFSAFRAARCHSTTPWRCIYYIDIFRINDMIVFEICANAFLLHMVRNIVGALMVVGRKQQDPAWIAQLLAQRDRTKAPKTAPAMGLYLVSVGYPAKFGIPKLGAGPSFVGRELSSLAAGKESETTSLTMTDVKRANES